jgi:zinc transport system ATP-binding protein
MGNQFHGMTKVSCSGFCCTKIEHFGVNAGHAEILRDVSMHVHCGELTALIGPNGAGKSTLLKAMLGEIPHSGELHFLSASGSHGANPVIGYVPQALNLDRTAPANVLDLFIAAGSGRPAWLPASARQKRRIAECLERVGAEHLANRRLGALSGGELQRVLLAMALEPVPDLLLLDEPVSGVDQNGMKAFFDQVSTLRATFDLSIIMVTHDLDLIPSYADRVVLLNRTVLANGSPEDVFSSEPFRAAFPAHTVPKTPRFTVEQLSALKNGKEEPR